VIDKLGLSVKHIDHQQMMQMIPLHYLHKRPAIVVCKLGLWTNELVGMCVFALPVPATSIRYGGPTWELARLWLKDEMPRNSESWFIGRAIRHVKQCHPTVHTLVSYADPQHGHQGIIYKASNWTYDGVTDSDRKTPRFSYFVDGKEIGRVSHANGRTVEKVRRTGKHRFYYKLGRKK